MGRGWLKTHQMKTPRTTHRSDASCNVAFPHENLRFQEHLCHSHHDFLLWNTAGPLLPGTGWSPGSATGSGGMTAPREGAPAGRTHREEPVAERVPALHACSSEAAPNAIAARKTEASLNSLEMQKYLFWFPSLFLEILFWFIKHRKSQHLKQTFKTPMWQIIDFLGN